MQIPHDKVHLFVTFSAAAIMAHYPSYRQFLQAAKVDALWVSLSRWNSKGIPALGGVDIFVGVLRVVVLFLCGVLHVQSHRMLFVGF